MKNRISGKVIAAAAAMSVCLAASSLTVYLPAYASQTEESLRAAETEEDGEKKTSETEGEKFDREQAESEIAASVDLDTLAGIKDDSGRKADEWLPVGSVVLLNGANKTLMVMSRFVYNNDDGLYYEYCGCLYPEGFAGDRYYFFNQEDIALVVEKGYEDDYERLYRSEVLDGLDIALLNSQSETEIQTEADTETAG